MAPRDREAQRKAIEGLCCLACGDPTVDPAHLWPRSQGGDESWENIAPFCRGCHRAFDRGELDVLQFLSWQRVAKVIELAARWTNMRSNGFELARRRLLPSEYRAERERLPVAGGGYR